MFKIIIRSCIIFLWVLLLSALLYLPKLGVLRFDEKTIHVFAWGDILDPNIVAAFEKETGIKVKLSYYSSNEELIVKVKATEGFGYDLIIPSDYAVRALKADGLLKELDHKKLGFINRINPLLLNHAFDPNNRYSIPFSWEVFGFGIDRDFFTDPEIAQPSWKLIFAPTKNYNIVMLNDSYESILFAALYLYGPDGPLNNAQYEQVKDLLFAQKKWVEAYADFRGDYFLATKSSPLAVASSSYIFRSKQRFPFIDFIVPNEGTYLTVESFSIPKLTEKEDLVYQFICYIMQPPSVIQHYQTFRFFPALSLDPRVLGMGASEEKIYHSTLEEFSRYHFYKTILPDQKVHDLWIELKSL